MCRPTLFVKIGMATLRAMAEITVAVHPAVGIVLVVAALRGVAPGAEATIESNASARLCP